MTFRHTMLKSDLYKEFKMKALNQKLVLQAVQKNVQVYTQTQGESELVGLDDFDERMLDLFDTLFENEVRKISFN